MSATGTSVLEIARGTGDGETHYECFEVPYTPGQSVLDGLLWVREHADASVGFRFSCINANVCKECVMRVDGRNAYACLERLKPGIRDVSSCLIADQQPVFGEERLHLEASRKSES